MRLIRERRNLLICIAAVILSLAPLPAKSDPIRRYQAVQIAYDEAEKVLRVAIVPVELQWNDYAGMERLEEEKNCFVLNFLRVLWMPPLARSVDASQI